MHNRTYRIVYTGIFAVLLAVCSWISIPTVIPFTLQTFAVFLTVLLLGGKQGTLSILIYLLLGAVGIPVFSNFGAGVGYLFGNTGGYAIGFLFVGISSWLFEKLFGRKRPVQLTAIILGLLFCYTFGTFWFLNISMSSANSYSTMSALTMCVFPFIIPDICKLILAHFISKRVKHMLY